MKYFYIDSENAPLKANMLRLLFVYCTSKLDKMCVFLWKSLSNKGS